MPDQPLSDRFSAAKRHLGTANRLAEEIDAAFGGVVSAAGGTGVAPAAAHGQAAPSGAVAAAREEHKVPAAVLEAEDSLLTFWMMRGGGESGDAAVAPWFRPDGAALRTLDAEEKVQEIARMLGGVTITEQTLAHAREMLES